MYWEMVLDEVLNKHSRENFRFTNINISKKSAKRHLKSKQKRRCSMYTLGKQFQDIYFSKREAECMVYLLKGKSIKAVAKRLNLSPRTVEYYIENMKKKLDCKTKFDLIDLVMDSEFLGGVDFA